MPVRIELRTDMFCSFNLLLFLLLTFYLVRPLRQQQHGSPSRFDKQNAISRARDNLVWSGAGVPLSQLPSPSFELEDNSHRLLFFLRPVVACLWNIWKFRFLFQLSKRTFFFFWKIITAEKKWWSFGIDHDITLQHLSNSRCNLFGLSILFCIESSWFLVYCAKYIAETVTCAFPTIVDMQWLVTIIKNNNWETTQNPTESRNTNAAKSKYSLAFVTF